MKFSDKTEKEQGHRAAGDRDVQQHEAAKTIEDRRESSITQRQLAETVAQSQPMVAQRQLAETMAQQFEDGQSNQTGMPNQLKAGIESLSGIDMSAVRVHHNSAQPAQLNALAYTQGNQIHLGPGQEQHLPHEAWHVVQQMQGRVKPTLQAKGIDVNNEPGLEQEADEMGAKALQFVDNGLKKFLPSKKNYSNNAQPSIQRMLWPKKKKDQPTAEGTSWDGNTQEIKELYLWCNDEDEFSYWTENESYLFWRNMDDNDQEDAHKTGSVASYKAYLESMGKKEETVSASAVSENADVVPAKEQARKARKEEKYRVAREAKNAKKGKAPESEQERQIRLGVEADARRRQESEQRAEQRREKFSETDYSLVEDALKTNDIAFNAWTLAVEQYQSGSSTLNISGGLQPYDDLVAALNAWSEAASKITKSGLGVIARMSKFKTVKDKSERPDGGKNAMNLVERKYQASFIIFTDRGDINVHIDSTPQ